MRSPAVRLLLLIIVCPLNKLLKTFFLQVGELIIQFIKIP